jgi:hypothetical protein
LKPSFQRFFEIVYTGSLNLYCHDFETLLSKVFCNCSKRLRRDACTFGARQQDH